MLGNAFRSIILCLAAFFQVGLFASTARSECDLDYSDHVLKLDVRFSFAENSKNTEEILGSIQPEVRLDEEYVTADVESFFQSNVLVTQICIRKAVTAGQRVSIKYGPRTMTAVVRPFAWNRVRNKQGQLVQVGSQPPISFSNQDSPDWVIPVRAKVRRDGTGRKMIYVEFLNPASKAVNGFEIGFSASDSIMWCMSVPHSQEVHVLVKKTEKKVLTASVTDPIFGGVLDTPAKMVNGPCGEHRLTMTLGDSGDFGPNERSVVRYIFDNNFLDDPHVLGMGEILSMGLAFRGGYVYPEGLDIAE